MNSAIKLLAVFIWLVAVLTFFISVGRLPDFFVPLYEQESFSYALHLFSARPVPVDIITFALGLTLAFFLVAQAVSFKRRMLGVMVVSVKLAPVALCFVALIDFLGWAGHRGLLPVPAYIEALMPVVLLTVSIGLSFLFFLGIKSRVKTPNKWFSYPLCSAFVWANMATIFAVIQATLVTGIRFYR